MHNVKVTPKEGHLEVFCDVDGCDRRVISVTPCWKWPKNYKMELSIATPHGSKILCPKCAKT